MMSHNFTVKYINGLSLRELIRQKAPLELRTTFIISESILSTLVEIQEKNFIYRYINPDEIIIEDDSNNPIFIEAAFPRDTDIFSYTGINGKHILINEYLYNAILYFSSEPLTYTKEEFKTAVFICLFGILFYEMLAGEIRRDNGFLEALYSKLNKPVFDLKKRIHGLENGIRNILQKAITKAPEKRYKNLREVLDGLKEVKELALAGVEE